MFGLSLGKNEKLLITAYKSSKRSRSDKVDKFQAMFNPSSVKRSSSTNYRKQKKMNSGGRLGFFSSNQAEQVSLNILIDGTLPGAKLSKPSSSLSTPPQKIDVTEQVNKFLKLCYHINGSIHQPNYLKLLMGNALKEFPCRLTNYSIEYSSFDGKGNPQRAEIQATFTEDMDSSKQSAMIGLESPDLTHHRLVRGKDNLPLMTKKIYGSSEYYIQVARVNELDHLRQLSLGDHLVFPPLVNKTEE